MATYSERVAELEKRHAEARESLDREMALLKLVPDSMLAELEVMAHPHKLWDRAGSLHFKYQQYESIRKGRQPEMRDALALSQLYLPVEMALYRDGCVSFRTLEDARRELEKAQSRMADGHETSATYTPIAAFVVSYELASYSLRVTLSFIGSTPVGPVEFKFEFPVYGDVAKALGSPSIRWSSVDYDRRRVESKEFSPSAGCRVIEDARCEYLRRPNSADGKEPGALEVYWCSYNGEPSRMTLADLMRAMGGK